MNALDLDLAGYVRPGGSPAAREEVGFVPLALRAGAPAHAGRATERAVAVDASIEVDAVKPRVQAVLGPEYEVSTWHDRRLRRRRSSTPELRPQLDRRASSCSSRCSASPTRC